MYNEVPSKISFPKMEEEILEFWEKKHIFNKSIEQRMDKEDFVFYDGPPGTNGYPHIGHMLQSTLKDLWPRYKTMKGFRVIRKAGWDTHGLPVELTAEKELGLTSKKDIIKYGIDKFIDYCRKTVFRYKEEWVTAIKRIGRFLDFDDEYATLTNEFIQSDWWVLKQAWNKGLVYKDYKIIAYCPRLGTSLSNHEVAQGYRDVVDISIFAKFPLKNESNTSFIAWTTTPWTLLGNVALALGEDIDYVKIQVNDEYYIFAEERIQALKDKGFLKDYKLIQRYKGKDLVDIDYIPLWDFHSHLPERKHFTLNDDYVTTEDGTGIVHLALYGEDDYRLIKKNNLPYVQHVDLNGLFTEECGEYANHYFDEDAMDIKILKDLSSKNLVFAKEKYEHTYPFNYRTGTKLIYFAKSSWFLKTTAFKDQMIKANQDINWYPSHIRDGRFGNWLENNVDWDISRERYWGSPLPIWTCINESCGHQICVSSIDELNEFAITRIDDNFDLHVPKIDTVMCKCNKCGSEMKREPDVLDCWYNSGVMPWGQLSYPSKKGSDKLLKKLYPADFICEGLDQTRGWFYALIALSTMLTNQSSYKNVICTELVLDKDGHKMSKSKGNVVDPIEMFDKYGADSMRWLFLNTNPGNPIRFSEDAITENIKQIILPVWNIYSFFVTYANIDKYKPEKKSFSSLLYTNKLDNWIFSETSKLIIDVTNALDNYNPYDATQSINQYIDKLSNWYIRRSRRRFWKSENDNDKMEAYNTLYIVFIDFLKVIAPFLPFITEYIYQNIVQKIDTSTPESIHLCDYPIADEKNRNLTLENEMNLIRELVNLGLSVRNKYNCKIRQPLSEIIVICHENHDQRTISDMEDIIKEELNIEKLTIEDKENVELSCIPDFSKLGPKFGKDLNTVKPLIEALSNDQINELKANQRLTLKFEKKNFEILYNEVIIKSKYKTTFYLDGNTKLGSNGNKEPKLEMEYFSSDNFSIALNNEITPELKRKGLAREFINKVQNMRKDLSLDVLDKIKVEYHSSDIVKESVEKHIDYIKTETLAEEIECLSKSLNGRSKNWDLNGETSSIAITKI